MIEVLNQIENTIFGTEMYETLGSEVIINTLHKRNHKFIISHFMYNSKDCNK